MSDTRVTLVDPHGGKRVELPVRLGTAGPPAVDVGDLYRETGFFAFDPGFVSTASCRSAITFIDGERGILWYRGYPIEQLAERSSFLEVAYLLLHGRLPTATELDAFSDGIRRHTMLHEGFRAFFDGFRHDAHPMAILLGAVGSLAAFYPDATDVSDPTARNLGAQRLIAKMPTIAAASYKHAVGQPLVYPDNTQSYAGNLLRMAFSVPCEEYVMEPVAERALDVLFILHADHEQNASTTAVRLAGSTGANPFACIAAGIATLWGPAHGGASEAAVRMLEEIGGEHRIPAFIARAKDRGDTFRLAGFGHRVYKQHDPRARIIRTMCHDVLNTLRREDDPLFAIALTLEEQALKDEYFIERKLYPNVDFYSGIIYRALGIPREMYTVMFAIARTVGWVAHWMELMGEPQRRIGRPRQVYDGPARREYLPIDERAGSSSR